jgi:glucose-1-phosphate adenylyltransferase
VLFRSQAVVLPDARIGKGVMLKRVVIDRGCVIPAGMTIGINQEEDKKRFFVTDRGVTLVTPEMLGQDIHLFR